MFDKLDDLILRYEEVMNLLSEPDVANDTNRFRNLMKEQANLAPIVDAYKEYKACKETVDDSLAMLEEESDEEMRDMLKEELSTARKRIEELETQLKRWRGSSPFCGRDVSSLCTLCGKPWLESGTSGSRRDRHRWYEVSQLYGKGRGRLFRAQV